MKSDILFSDLTVYPVELVNAKKDRGKLCILFYTLYTGCLFFDSQTSFDKYFYGINFCTILMLSDIKINNNRQQKIILHKNILKNIRHVSNITKSILLET